VGKNMKYKSQEDFEKEIESLRRRLDEDKQIGRDKNEGELKVDFELPFSSLPQVGGPRWQN
jgi:hypothetical protein